MKVSIRLFLALAMVSMVALTSGDALARGGRGGYYDVGRTVERHRGDGGFRDYCSRRHYRQERRHRHDSHWRHGGNRHHGVSKVEVVFSFPVLGTLDDHYYGHRL